MSVLEDVVRALTTSRGAPDRALVQVAIAGVDLDAARASAEERVRYEVWDRVSPIGDSKAEDIRARLDYAGGDVYTVWVDDQLSILQAHLPGVSGLQPITDPVMTAIGHAVEIVDALVAQETADRARDVLRASGALGG